MSIGSIRAKLVVTTFVATAFVVGVLGFGVTGCGGSCPVPGEVEVCQYGKKGNDCQCVRK
jgi:hypothetical protein